MSENIDRITELLKKLNELSQKQEDFSREINSLRLEIIRLKGASIEKTFDEEIKSRPIPVSTPAPTPPPVDKEKVIPPLPQPVQSIPSFAKTAPKPTVPHVKSDLEKFIGENLINKIRIVIVILGVSIGAKYAIDHKLISPLTRIILGYVVGLGLMGFAMKLKAKYENFSAVLLSGSMTILYFISFAAYSFFGLFPREVVFGLMVLFTIFTVIAALNYNRQIIAHFGLVGAYAVPFLLSNGSGQVAVLFSYMTIVNIGILIISFKKYWKALYYVSFALSWLIYLSWFATSYIDEIHFKLALVFLAVFFATFYTMFVSYKLIRKEKFEGIDIVMLLGNSFLFYSIGYSILNMNRTGMQLLGLFTLGNAIIHFVVSVIFYKRKLADRNLFYLVSGLVLVFITIAIPVQLDGNVVTLLWSGEAAILFWIGRTKTIPVYERLSYPLMMLSFLSLVQDWSYAFTTYSYGMEYPAITPIFNVHFLSAVIFIAFFFFINYINSKKEHLEPSFKWKEIVLVMNYLIPGILIITIYLAFRVEICSYFNHLFSMSAIDLTKVSPEKQSYANNQYDYDIIKFRAIWLINYTLLFLSALSFVNMFKLKNRNLAFLSLILNVICTGIFLVQALYYISDLRESYLQQTMAEYYHRGMFNLTIRYISLTFAALMVFTNYRYIKQDFFKVKLKMQFDFYLHIVLLWIISSEFINWMDISGSEQSYKLGLSILWGVYALLLVVFGINKKKKYLRVAGITLFGLTLIKLFFYDIAHLNTISKTIVFISLGILLLIISFLYNKYKHKITDDVKE